MVITVTLNPAVDKVLEVPGFRVGDHARAELRGLMPAGKGHNVSRGLARMGVPSIAMGFIGRDAEREFTDSLEAEGIEVDMQVVPGRTRVNTTVVDPVGRTTTHLREPGFRVTEADLRAIRDALERRLDAASEAYTVVFAGSTPPGCTPEAFSELLAACAEREAQVVVDTNGPPLLVALAGGHVDTLKPNLAELGECLGRAVVRDEALGAARGLLDRVQTVLLTLGEDGAYVVSRAGVVGGRCPLEAAEVHSNTGCGDAFLAGWLRGRTAGLDEAESLRWALAAGAANAMSAIIADYSGADVERLLPRCERL